MRSNIVAVVIRITLALLMLVNALLLAPLSRPDLRQDYMNACMWWLALPGDTFSALSACPADLTAAIAGPTAHPPFATLMILPLALLPWPLAYYAWIVLGCLCVLAVWLFYKVPLAACAATLPLWTAGLARGTLEPIIFLVLALAFLQTDRPRRRFALLGLAAAFKVYPVLLLGAAVLRRRPAEVITAAICGVLASLLAELVLGVGTTVTWLQFTPGNMLRWIDNPDNVSLVHVLWSVLNVSPSVIALVLYLILLFVLARRRGQTITEQSLIPIMILATPLAWSHYLGHLTLMPLSRWVVVLLAIGSGLLLLTSLDILPVSNAALVYPPLLAAVLLAWYQSLTPPARAEMPKQH